MTVVIFILVVFLAPAVLLKLEEKYSWMNSLLGAYSLGILLSQMIASKEIAAFSKEATGVSIVLAICLLLLGADVKSWRYTGKETLISAFVFFTIVPIVTILSIKISNFEIDDLNAIGGMLTAVYTGSLPNMFVVGTALGVEANKIIILQLADMTFCGLFSLVILSPLVKKLYSFLPKKVFENNETVISNNELQVKKYILSLIISIVLIGIGVGLSKIFKPELEQLIIFGFVSTAAVLIAAKGKFRLENESNKLGNYFLLVFCISVGSMINFDQLFQAKSLPIFILTALVIIVSTIVHMVYCYFAKVDRDTAIITMTAAIFSPAFVPAVIKNLRNPQLLISGVAAALIGLFIGTYSGFLVGFLLS